MSNPLAEFDALVHNEDDTRADIKAHLEKFKVLREQRHQEHATIATRYLVRAWEEQGHKATRVKVILRKSHPEVKAEALRHADELVKDLDTEGHALQEQIAKFACTLRPRLATHCNCNPECQGPPKQVELGRFRDRPTCEDFANRVEEAAGIEVGIGSRGSEGRVVWAAITPLEDAEVDLAIVWALTERAS